MHRIITLIALIGYACAATIQDDFYGRIVNGEETTIQDHPYQVSIQDDTGFHFCGGSIINKNTIVTAAHCLVGQKDTSFKVRLGSTRSDEGGHLVSVRDFKYHEGYNKVSMVNDVGIIKLATPVPESSKVRYVKLAEETPETGTTAVVTGWGTECFLICKTSEILKKVELEIVDKDTCASDAFKYGPSIEDTMVCAYSVKKDACQGDSGGPLVADNELVGIVSWGRSCAKAGYPGVYCDVSDVRDWILEQSASL